MLVLKLQLAGSTTPPFHFIRLRNSDTDFKPNNNEMGENEFGFKGIPLGGLR